MCMVVDRDLVRVVWNLNGVGMIRNSDLVRVVRYSDLVRVVWNRDSMGMIRNGNRMTMRRNFNSMSVRSDRYCMFMFYETDTMRMGLTIMSVRPRSIVNMSVA